MGNDDEDGIGLRCGFLKKNIRMSVFFKVQVWLENHYNFAKMVLQCGLSSTNYF